MGVASLRFVGRSGLFLLLLLFLPAVASAAANFSAQDGFGWLVGQMGSDGSFDGDVTKTTLALLTLDAAGADTSLTED
mgnify:FL=1